MELYKEILIHALKQESLLVTFSNPDIDEKEIVNIIRYQALQKIKAILEDDSLSDVDCFMQIEKIVEVFESRFRLKESLSLLFTHKMDILNEVQLFATAPHFPYYPQKGARFYVPIRCHPRHYKFYFL